MLCKDSFVIREKKLVTTGEREKSTDVEKSPKAHSIDSLPIISNYIIALQ